MLSASVLLGVAQFLGIYLPLKVSIYFIIAAVVVTTRKLSKKKIGILTFSYFLIYILPFMHLVPYLWTDVMDKRDQVWGLVANPFHFDVRVMQLVGMMAVAGISGMFVSFLRHQKLSRRIFTLTKMNGTMPLLIWCSWVIIGVFFSYISAPRETLLTAAYTTSSSASRDLNMSSVWLFSYIILLFALYDCLNEKSRILQRIKSIFLLFLLFM